jgi:hypothetical protein
LDAGNPGCEYLWSNGAVSRTIQIEGAGIMPEIQSYHVRVTNEHECSSTSSISVIYSYSACTGLNEPGRSKHIRIYPNPSTGIFTLVNPGLMEDICVSITNIHGKLIKTLFLKKSESGYTTETLDITGYPKGMYLIRFGNNSQLWTEKLVIQ